MYVRMYVYLLVGDFPKDVVVCARLALQNDLSQPLDGRGQVNGLLLNPFPLLLRTKQR